MTLIAEGELVTSALTVFELEAGAHTERRRTDMDDFLSRLVVLDLDEPSARRAGEIYRVLARAGMRIDRADALIAGIALSHGLQLLTRNVRHFERVPGLSVLTI
jgi:predicted nucleic acid-binding protein